jgi:hypothetical protein
MEPEYPIDGSSVRSASISTCAAICTGKATVNAMNNEKRCRRRGIRCRPKLIEYSQKSLIRGMWIAVT